MNASNLIDPLKICQLKRLGQNWTALESPQGAICRLESTSTLMGKLSPYQPPFFAGIRWLCCAYLICKVQTSRVSLNKHEGCDYRNRVFDVLIWRSWVARSLVVQIRDIPNSAWHVSYEIRRPNLGPKGTSLRKVRPISSWQTSFGPAGLTPGVMAPSPGYTLRKSLHWKSDRVALQQLLSWISYSPLVSQ